MTESNNNNNDPQRHATPVSAVSSPQHDREANAPEVVEVAHTPSTFVASPETVHSHQRIPAGSHGESADDASKEKEVIFFDPTEKVAVPVANEYQTSPSPQVISGPNAVQKADADAERASTHTPPTSKILGLRRKVFFIILALVCVIVVAAVGGGVGGALGSKKSSPGGASRPSSTMYVITVYGDIYKLTSSSSSGVSSASTSATNPSRSATTSPSASTTTTPTKSSTSSATKPTATFLNQTDTDSGHFFQGFSELNMTGKYTDIVDQEDGEDFKFNIRSYEWVAKNTNCCLSFCKNDTKEGWVGYVCQSRKQPEASDAFSRVFVWCDNNHTEGFATGRCAK